jgi:hypothetical protein
MAEKAYGLGEKRPWWERGSETERGKALDEFMQLRQAVGPGPAPDPTPGPEPSPVPEKRKRRKLDPKQQLFIKLMQSGSMLEPDVAGMGLGDRVVSDVRQLQAPTMKEGEQWSPERQAAVIMSRSADETPIALGEIGKRVRSTDLPDAVKQATRKLLGYDVQWDVEKLPPNQRKLLENLYKMQQKARLGKTEQLEEKRRDFEMRRGKALSKIRR